MTHTSTGEVSVIAQQMLSGGDNSKPTIFRMKAPLLDQGRSNNALASTKNIWATLKVYASGGENGLHAHVNEDHMFVVMQGRATFYGPNGEEQELGKNQGIMLPAHVYYNFQSTAPEPLVLLRIGCRVGPPDSNPNDRLDIDGVPKPPDSKANGREEVIVRPNAFFE